MITRGRVIEIGHSWLGVPYLHQGRTRLGVDCIGFVFGVAKEAGCIAADMQIAADYPRRVRVPSLFDGIAANCTLIERAEPACLVLVRWPREAYPSHVSLFTGDSLLHSYQRAGRVVQHGFRKPWTMWAHSFWRLPDVVHV